METSFKCDFVLIRARFQNDGDEEFASSVFRILCLFGMHGLNRSVIDNVHGRRKNFPINSYVTYEKKEIKNYSIYLKGGINIGGI